MAETYLNKIFTTVRLDPPKEAAPMITDNFGKVADEKAITNESRVRAAVGRLLQNRPPATAEDNAARFDNSKVRDVFSRIDRMIDYQMDWILHNEQFQEMEAS